MLHEELIIRDWPFPVSSWCRLPPALPSSSVLDLLLPGCIASLSSLPSGFSYLFHLFLMLVFPPPTAPRCVNALRGILQNRKAVREATAGSVRQGCLFSSTHSLFKMMNSSAVFSPMGLCIVESNQKDMRGEGLEA